ncbi:MAG TPA: dipeptidase [Myxococcales bacterium]|nr:hypothetical protein [Deltaproteobacteria bacterium]HAA58213.1 dipeptidase [Myxococcales bacterium]
MNKETLQTIYKQHQSRYMQEWETFLAFPSISAMEAHQADCEACASWLVSHLQGMGMDATLLEKDAKPVVFATYHVSDDAPTVLYYGHYDVQPVDPLELWESEPFTPTRKGNRLYVRGAQDNKGQTFYVLKALETLISQDALAYNIKFMLEGEEEIGSPGLAEAAQAWKDTLQADILMVCDTCAPAPGIPAISMGLRGIAYFEVELSGITSDLHSGAHGGMVKNPAVELARLIATFHDEDGHITVEGFYDDVAHISEEDRALANQFPFDTQTYIEQFGVEPIGGEKAFNAIESRGFRPTLEVNGFHSGYGGQGVKTIIPAQATAKFSARLVGHQDPEKSLEQLLTHTRKHAPKGLKMTIRHATAGGPAILLSSQSPLIQHTRTILNQLGEHETVLAWEGISIPIVADLATLSGAEPLLVGFGLEEDRIHAPNESFDLDQFALGFLYAGLFLSTPFKR